MKRFLATLFVWGTCLPWAAAQPPAPAGPPVTITLGARHGHVTPVRHGFTHTGGGNIDVAQPSPDTLVVTMTGVAVAGGHPCMGSVAALEFDLNQCLEIAFADPKVKRAKLTIEGRVIGLLRSHAKGGGSAEQAKACASVTAGPVEVIALSVAPHGVTAGENLSVNCREGPLSVPVAAGPYTLRQTFTVTANHGRSMLPCKAASVEFAPDPALDPLWISYWEPFHGASKKDFGFQATIKVADDTAAAANGSEKAVAAEPPEVPNPSSFRGRRGF